MANSGGGGDGDFSGTATIAGNVNFTIFLKDDGNATTPSCDTNPLGDYCPGMGAGVNFDPWIYDTATAGGFVTSFSSANVRVIDTTTPAATATTVAVGSPAVVAPQGIAVNPADPRLVYVATGSDSVRVFCTRGDLPGAEFPIGCLMLGGAPSTGSTVLDDPIALFLTATEVAVSKTGTFTLVGDGGANRVFRIGTDPSDPMTFNSVTTSFLFMFGAPQGAAIRPQGDYACVATGTAKVFIIDTGLTGPPVEATLSSAPASPVSKRVAISPDGRFCYVTDSSNNVVHAVDIEPTSPTFANDVGNAGPNSGSQALALTPDGRYLLATESHRVNRFRAGD